MKVEQRDGLFLEASLIEARYLTGVSHRHAEAGNYTSVMQGVWRRLMEARYQAVLTQETGVEQSGFAEILRDNPQESSMIRSIACMMLSDQEERLRSAGTEIPDIEIEVPITALEVVYRVADEDVALSLNERLARSDIAECAAAEQDQLHRLQGIALGVRDALRPLMREGLI
jgi:hypothetical protein